jgi:hypothetical protein
LYFAVMAEPAPAVPEKPEPPSLVVADWPQETIRREVAMQAALAASRKAFRDLLAAIAG